MDPHQFTHTGSIEKSKPIFSSKKSSTKAIERWSHSIVLTKRELWIQCLLCLFVGVFLAGYGVSYLVSFILYGMTFNNIC